MERLFLECTVRAALLVGVTAIVLYGMRIKAATARHSVWAGVVAFDAIAPDLGRLGTQSACCACYRLWFRALRTRQKRRLKSTHRACHGQSKCRPG